MDIKLSKAQLTKIIQSSGFLASVISNLGKFCKSLGKEALSKVAAPSAKGVLPGLVSLIASNAASNVLNKFERRISGKRAVRVGKGFT